MKNKKPAAEIYFKDLPKVEAKITQAGLDIEIKVSAETSEKAYKNYLKILEKTREQIK